MRFAGVLTCDHHCRSRINHNALSSITRAACAAAAADDWHNDGQKYQNDNNGNEPSSQLFFDLVIRPS